MSVSTDKVLEKPASVIENEATDAFIAHRIFINNVDMFQGKYIASYMADQYHGAKSNALENEPLAAEDAYDIGEGTKIEIPDDRNKYEIIGSLSTSTSIKTEDVSYTLDEKSENFPDEISKCGTIIYDITRDPNQIVNAINTMKLLNAQYDEIKKIGPKTYQNHPRNQTFILISTVMTWAKTKGTFTNEKGGFTEAQYRRRKAHPLYHEHLACEKQIMALGKKHNNKLRTFVIASGFSYGYEQESLDYLFKLAWSNEHHLPVFGNGTNFIPLIHISDLSKIIGYIIMNSISEKRYILAVEPVAGTQKKIVKAVSKTLCKGYTKEIHTPEEASAYKVIDSNIYNKFTINLKMIPAVVMENMPINWTYPTGFCENIGRLVEELKESRELTSIKMIMHGPPACGKTRLAKRICEEYGLHYISVKTLIEETLQGLRDDITEEKARLEAKRMKEEIAGENDEDIEEEEEEELEEEEEPAVIEELEEQIRDIQTVLSESEGNKLPDEQVVKLLKEFLRYNICQNQGFVLDGFPKTIEQARDIFGDIGKDEDEEAGEEEEDEEDKFASISDSKIMPDYVFSLKAPDSFLCRRIKKQKEKALEGTHYTEEHIKRRLQKFRELNTEDETVLNFFDELEVHPVIIDVTKDNTENMDLVFDTISRIIGKPIKFGMTVEESSGFRYEEEEQMKQKLEELEYQKKVAEQEMIEDYRQKMMNWSKTLEQIKCEEEKVIIAEGEPLRNYLMEFIFPTLTKALTEVVKIKPDDPVDFIAEYLFKINPEGKLFDSTYSQQGEQLINVCKQTTSSTYQLKS